MKTIHYDLRIIHRKKIAIGALNRKEIEKSKVPAALTRFLRERPEVDMVVFHLDNDRTGRLATQAIRTVLPKKYQTKDEPPKQGKDCNDSLCIRLGIRQTKREKRHRERSLER